MSTEGEALQIQRALAGDAVAAIQLVESLSPVVQRRVAAVLLRSGGRSSRDLRPEVEDLTQEVLLSLFADGGKILSAWEPERGLSLHGFVGLVARRQVVSLLRSRRRNPFSLQPVDPLDLEELGPAAEQPDALQSSETRQVLEQLAQKLQERLSPLGLQMFQMLFVSQEPAEEVSQKTGFNIEAVYQWRSRLKKAALEVQAELALEPARTLRQAGAGMLK